MVDEVCDCISGEGGKDSEGGGHNRLLDDVCDCKVEVVEEKEEEGEEEEGKEEKEEEAAQLTAALQYNTDCESETGFDKDQHPVTLCQCTPM